MKRQLGYRPDAYGVLVGRKTLRAVGLTKVLAITIGIHLQRNTALCRENWSKTPSAQDTSQCSLLTPEER